MQKTYTTGQIAKMLRVAPRTVTKWIDSGRLSGYRLPGSNDRRVLRENYVAFCRENRLPHAENGVLLFTDNRAVDWGTDFSSIKILLTESDLPMTVVRSAIDFGSAVTLGMFHAIVVCNLFGSSLQQTIEAIPPCTPTAVILVDEDHRKLLDGHPDIAIFSFPLNQDMIHQWLLRVLTKS